MTTNRCDYTWPFFAQSQQIFDWDQYKYKSHPSKTKTANEQHAAEKIEFRNSETLKTIPNSEKLPFDFNSRPKLIVGDQQPINHYPTETLIKYEKDKVESRYKVQKSRPRVFKCPQISFDDISDDRRDIICKFVYNTTKSMNELTSGVPECRSVSVDFPLKPYGDPGKFRSRPVYPDLAPFRNYRQISVAWDGQQRRIFGGRSID
ncbi:uncharacterized protein LOC126845868 [Adelges cooleyi]|uniref:uncharacterized protein LOC126845868 n=1 Tax=Adelges cooleyi TaxID=133065 RepID=UPI00217FAEF3|nr:uncharacterized protein LOC126845868 [Adelges cooleyi]